MNKIYVLLIIIITLLVWRPILDLVPMGEGYYYFDSCQSQFLAPSHCLTTIWQYDNLARTIFQIIIPILGENIELYSLAQMVMMIFVYITFYVVLSTITKNKFFAFIVTLIFIANYTGSFSMMATGNYQRFVQRVPNLIPILISFYYLTKYFEKNILKNLGFSLALFVFGIFISHHSIFMIPLFISFIIIKTTKKSFLVNLTMIFFIGVSSIIITKSDHLKPTENIISFVKNTPQIVEKTYLQIPNLIVPTEFVRYFAKNWVNAPILFPFTKILNYTAIPIFLLLIVPLLTIKKKTNVTELYKASIITLPIVCFLNLYAYGDGAPHPLKSFGEDRIYFIASIFSSIILGTYVNFLWNSKNKLFKIASIGILLAIFFYNQRLIKTDMDKLRSNSLKMESFIEYVKLKTMDKNSKLTIIGPSHLMWPNQFTDYFYNTNENLEIILDSSNWNETIDKSDSKRIVLIDYKDDKVTERIIK